MTDNLDAWRGDFGREYWKRNPKTIEEMDDMYESRYGVTRTWMNEQSVTGLPWDMWICEVGCGIGLQLESLQRMWFANLVGIDPNIEAIQSAMHRTEGIHFAVRDCFDIPPVVPLMQKFDMVFTSGVLIHIPPERFMEAVNSIYNATSRYIWGFEYWSESPKEIRYHDCEGMLWKDDYPQMWQAAFPKLKLLSCQKYPHLDGSGNVDCMYLLEKTE